MVKRAENAGCLAVAVTVDRSGGRNQETLSRLRRTATRECASCHDRTNLDTVQIRRAMYKGIDITKMKILAKGILAYEDAELAADYGLDGIIVSNHGGRSEDAGRSTIDALPEIVEAVNGRIPILIDSGFRRGTDIVKALSIGATAVCVGRPYLWGLGAFGQAGVERVLEILRTETRTAMAQCGVRNVKEI